MNTKTFEESCSLSKEKKAVAGPLLLRHNGKMIRAELIKPMEGDGTWVYANTGIPIRKATKQEIDTRRTWRPFN